MKEKQPRVFYGSVATVDINLNRRIKMWILFMQLGAKTGCHQLHERSFFFNGYQFPVCARCTGLFIGQISGLIFFFLFLKCDLAVFFFLALVSLLMLGVDGFFQLKKIWTSTNPRRFFTGLSCGFFVIIFEIKVISMVIEKING